MNRCPDRALRSHTDWANCALFSLNWTVMKWHRFLCWRSYRTSRTYHVWKKRFGVYWLFNITSLWVKFYRVVVPEKFYEYEYMSTVWGPDTSISIDASLIFSVVSNFNLSSSWRCVFCSRCWGDRGSWRCTIKQSTGYQPWTKAKPQLNTWWAGYRVTIQIQSTDMRT